MVFKAKRGGTLVLTLGALSLSPSATFTIGTPVTVNILGATAGSTIAITGNPASITINSAARTLTYDGTGTATSGSLTLTETLAGAANSPNPNSLGFSISSSGLPTPTAGTSSGAGVVPVVFQGSVTGALNAGGYIQWEIAATLTPTKNGDGTYTTTAQKNVSFVDGASWSGNSVSLGFVDPSGPFAFHWRALHDDPNGLITLTDQLGNTANYTATSNWSNDYTDTISASSAVYATSGNGHSGYETVSGTPALSLNPNNDSVHALLPNAATINAQHSTFQCEATINGWGTSGHVHFGFVDGALIDSGTINFSSPGYITGGSASYPGNTAAGITFDIVSGGTGISYVANNVSGGVTLPAAAAVGDVVIFIVNTSTNVITVHYWRAANSTLYTGLTGGTITLTAGHIPSVWRWFAGGERVGDSSTWNPGNVTFKENVGNSIYG